MVVNKGLFSDLQIKEQKSNTNSLNQRTLKEHKQSSRNIKVPSKFALAAEYESSSEYEESLDEED